MNLADLRTATLFHLGTSASDKAFPPARLNQLANDACNEIYAGFPAGVRQKTATWLPDGGVGRKYSLATQASPVTGLQRILSLRLVDSEGSRLRELAFDQRDAWHGLAYAVTGPDEASVVHTNVQVDSGVALYAEFEEWPAELTSDASVPSVIPLRFHDLIPLMMADVAFASGDEGNMPSGLRDRLDTRKAQLRAHVGRRSLDAMKQREPGTLVY